MLFPVHSGGKSGVEVWEFSCCAEPRPTRFCLRVGCVTTTDILGCTGEFQSKPKSDGWLNDWVMNSAWLCADVPTLQPKAHGSPSHYKVPRSWDRSVASRCGPRPRTLASGGFMTIEGDQEARRGALACPNDGWSWTDRAREVRDKSEANPGRSRWCQSSGWQRGTSGSTDRAAVGSGVGRPGALVSLVWNRVRTDTWSQADESRRPPALWS